MCLLDNFHYFINTLLLYLSIYFWYLYFTIYFSDYFYLYSLHFYRYLYFLLLTFQTRLVALVLVDHHSIKKYVIHHESVSIDWQPDSARARSTSPPKSLYRSNHCKRLENGVHQRGKTTDLCITSSVVSFICK